MRGRGLDLVTLTKDYNLMRWIGANCFRTSHYPYSEELMDLADQQGFMVINEVTWKVFSKELRQQVTSKVYWREAFRYYWLRFLLALFRWSIHVKQAFGYKASPEELQDFDIESH